MLLNARDDFELKLFRSYKKTRSSGNFLHCSHKQKRLILFSAVTYRALEVSQAAARHPDEPEGREQCGLSTYDIGLRKRQHCWGSFTQAALRARARHSFPLLSLALHWAVEGQSRKPVIFYTLVTPLPTAYKVPWRVSLLHVHCVLKEDLRTEWSAVTWLLSSRV